MFNSAEIDWDRFFSTLRKKVLDGGLPSVTQIAQKNRDPFRVLVSTMISLRTKDNVTLEASRRLFSVAAGPAETAVLEEQRIAELIYPAGFYKTKAGHIKETAVMILEQFDGEVPSAIEELLLFPGVGRKTANLVLNLGFGIDAICVDTHVHRIPNRMGLMKTKNPEESEYALMEKVPKRYWIELNELLVKYGQLICTPQSPRCSICPFQGDCPKIGVERMR